MRVFVTGAAGFIGFHVTKALLEQGHSVLGFDNLNDYYDPRIKEARLRVLDRFDRFSFSKGDLTDAHAVKNAWDQIAPDNVIHLAAQAGVRYSIENPMAYVQSNLVGFQNVLELARSSRVAHFVYASSSSVYGGNKVLPFSESQDVSNPISLYAATKASNELVAKSYGNLFKLPSTGLRFFTVYGPHGRPDMAMFKFAEMMRRRQKIPVFNQGKMIRDFTYIDDIVQGVVAAVKRPQIGQIYNLGFGSQVSLIDMINELEGHLRIKAEMDLLPMQAGDVEATLADVSKARRDLGYEPTTDYKTGIARFAEWYRNDFVPTHG